MRHLPLGVRGFAARFGTLAVLLALLLIPLPVAAWGKAGHRAVATLATTLLSAEAQAQVATLLDPGTTLADISTWADDIRPSRPNTGPWHYVNIPGGASGYNAQSDCAYSGDLGRPVRRDVGPAFRRKPAGAERRWAWVICHRRAAVSRPPAVSAASPRSA